MDGESHLVYSSDLYLEALGSKMDVVNCSMEHQLGYTSPAHS